MSKDAEKDYCGCCGQHETLPGGYWCDRCHAHVIHENYVPVWDRTYFALHGRDCPFAPKVCAPVKTTSRAPAKAKAAKGKGKGKRG